MRTKAVSTFKLRQLACPLCVFEPSNSGNCFWSVIRCHQILEAAGSQATFAVQLNWPVSRTLFCLSQRRSCSSPLVTVAVSYADFVTSLGLAAASACSTATRDDGASCAIGCSGCPWLLTDEPSPWCSRFVWAVKIVTAISSTRSGIRGYVNDRPTRQSGCALSLWLSS
ncbi:hypothetical protein C8R47DRAFT_457336 [Mycena vitilis]|nr:hypothetical protein C8R47DRAFT_457336 [Mycena vitilis]